MMFTVYWSSVLIGLVVGLLLGIAVSVFSVWLVDRQYDLNIAGEFSRGFDRGWECGIEHRKYEEIKNS